MRSSTTSPSNRGLVPKRLSTSLYLEAASPASSTGATPTSAALVTPHRRGSKIKPSGIALTPRRDSASTSITKNSSFTSALMAGAINDNMHTHIGSTDDGEELVMERHNWMGAKHSQCAGHLAYVRPEDADDYGMTYRSRQRVSAVARDLLRSMRKLDNDTSVASSPLSPKYYSCGHMIPREEFEASGNSITSNVDDLSLASYSGLATYCKQCAFALSSDENANRNEITASESAEWAQLLERERNDLRSIASYDAQSAADLLSRVMQRMMENVEPRERDGLTVEERRARNELVCASLQGEEAIVRAAICCEAVPSFTFVQMRHREITTRCELLRAEQTERADLLQREKKARALKPKNAATESPVHTAGAGGADAKIKAKRGCC